MSHLDPAEHDDRPTWAGQPAPPEWPARSADGRAPQRPVYRYAEDDYGNLHPGATGGWSEVRAGTAASGPPVSGGGAGTRRPVSGGPGHGGPTSGGPVGDRRGGRPVTPPAAGDPNGPPAGSDAAPPAPKAGRAGRNLPAAIGVGVALGAAVIVSLFIWRPGFLVLVAAAVSVGVWEMVRAVAGSGARPPLFPLLAGGVLMSGLAWWGRADALTFGLIITVLTVFIWRLGEGPTGYERDVTSATLIAVYVPFLAGFAVLLAVPADGDLRVVTALAAVVLSDTGGYIAGVFFGRHPMAPTVSPKKSWEGFAGSLVATSVGCALLLFFLFDAGLWQGALFGLGVSAAAVLGDLAESMVKRDLKIKDMSNLLPGHGGVMDRLDSILFAAPTAYVLFLLLVPAS